MAAAAATANCFLSPPHRTGPARCRPCRTGPRLESQLGRGRRVVSLVRSSLLQDLLILEASTAAAAGLAAGGGYSPASYYTSLGLFVISVPGLWSLIKRSVKSKVVQKTYVKNDGGAAAPNQVAGEILSFFTRNNFSVADPGETITVHLF